jgi:hypothetical protein
MNWEYVKNLKDMLVTYFKAPVRHSKEEIYGKHEKYQENRQTWYSNKNLKCYRDTILLGDPIMNECLNIYSFIIWKHGMNV